MGAAPEIWIVAALVAAWALGRSEKRVGALAGGGLYELLIRPAFSASGVLEKS